jgi:hypothetical protein
MKSNERWQNEQDALESARLLAQFANLEPEDAERFKIVPKYRDFVPAVWWDGRAFSTRIGTYVPWVLERDRLRASWEAEFPADKTLELVTSSLFLAAHAVASDTTEEMKNTLQRVWPYQSAVLFLHVNAWRAKICEWCGKRFVGEHSQARFCTYGVVVDGHETTCYWAHRKKYKDANWIENSATINEQRRLEYSAAKRRKSRAKRKNLRQR